MIAASKFCPDIDTDSVFSPLAILSHPEVIPKETYDALEPYFRQMIFYG